MHISHRQRKNSGGRATLPAIVGLLAFTAIFLLVWYEKIESAEKRQNEVATIADGLAHFFSLGIRGDRDFLLSGARQVAEQGYDPEEFEHLFGGVPSLHPGLVGISHADASYTITQITPPIQNRNLVGLKISMPDQMEASRLAAATGQPQYSRPTEILRGEQGFLLFVPVFEDNGDFCGLVIGVYTTEAMLSEGVPDSVKERYWVEIVDGDGGEISALDATGPIDTAISSTFPIDPPGNGVFIRLTAYETGAFGYFGVYLLGAIGLLIGVLVWGWATRGRLLGRLKRTTGELERQSSLNESVGKLAHALISSASIEDIAQLTLEHAIDITGSRQGFVGIMDKDSGRMKMATHTHNVWSSREGEEYPDGSEKFEAVRGLWGWVLENKEPLVSNDPSDHPASTGTPEGHVRINRFISVPALLGGELIGQIALANSETDYDSRDVLALRKLADLYAIALQRQRIEQGLRDSEYRFRTAILDAPLPVMIHAEDGEVITISRKWTELTGYSRSDIRTVADWTEKAFGADMDDIADYIGSLYDIDRLRAEGEYEITTSDGRTLTWDFSSAPIQRLRDGRRAVMSMAIDVTGRKKAELALRESERAMKAIMDNIPDRAWLKSAGGTVLAANEAYLEGCGLTLEQAVGREDSDIWPEQVARYFADTDAKVAQSGQRHVFQEHVVDNDGTERWFETVKTPIYDDDGNFAGTAGLAHEITDMFLLEKQRSDLHAMISHDIRTPLTLIVGNIEMLEKKYQEDQSLQSIAGTIRRSAAKITAMFEDYVALSRLESADIFLNIMPTDIRELVSDVCAEFEEPAKRRSLSLSFLEKGTVPKIYADSAYVHRALTNLLQNAVNYTPPDGSVTVGIQSAPVGSPDSVIIEVADTGPGIPAGERRKVFDKYYRGQSTASRVKGSGLGLAIVKAVAEAHGGEVALDIGPSGGCVFRMRLPMKPAE